MSRGPGDPVVAGTVATDTALRVRITAVGDDTALVGIQRLVAEAQSSSQAQRLADRAAKGGVLIKDRLALESMRTVDAVLFDKTGILTTGAPTVTHLALTDASEEPGRDVAVAEAELLALAAAVEADSEHPLGRAIVAAARERRVRVPQATGFQASAAAGVTGAVDGQQVSLGGPGLLRKHGARPLPVAELQAEGRKVAMVGDGVNHAPALAQADVGIAIGAGTDVAIASAGVILVSDDPRSVLSVIELSRASYRKMAQNLWWAAGYNLLAVPLAAGVLAPIGFVLPMEIGALLMSASTVVVALNALLLRRLDLRPESSALSAVSRQA